MPSSLFWSYDEKRETRTSRDNCNDQGKPQRGNTVLKILDELTKLLNVGRVTEALKEG